MVSNIKNHKLFVGESRGDILTELTHEQYERIKSHYWVLTYRNENASVFSWLFTQRIPMPVPNQSMYWRRPTYEETVKRQEDYEYYCEEHEESKEEVKLARKNGEGVARWIFESAEMNPWFKYCESYTLRKYDCDWEYSDSYYGSKTAIRTT